jgi:sialate O-acetylesterase
MYKTIVPSVLLLMSCITALADIRLPAIITDSMVLQQSMSVPVWGWASPGEKISVSANWPNATAVNTTTGADGRWILKIKTPAAGGPYELTVKGSQTIILHGVLIGEVWICSGQSNMEMPVRGWPPNDPIQNAAGEIASANNPRIRFFIVKKNVAYTPADDVSGKWSSCNPVSTADFSAIGYFFGRELSKNLNIPIGLISTNWGGTIAEAWTSPEGLKPLKDFDAAMKKLDSVRINMKQLIEEDKQNEINWNKTIREPNNNFLNADANSSDWKTMALPATWESRGLPNLDGIAWFKKEIDIPASWAGKSLKLELGTIDDNDITWFNGQLVDSTMKAGAYNLSRNYTVPGEYVKQGSNMISVKVIDNSGSGGIYGAAALMKIYPADGKPEDGISLAGDWKYKVQAAKPRPPVNNSPNQVSVLYNGMIAPIINYSIRGAIWYQGESNVERAAQYERLFPAMIADWRKHWNQGTFPFYFVQIAPFKYGDSTKAAALRDAQRRTLSASPNTGMAVTLDVGNATNIHPANKQDPAKRLALWALSKTYGKKDLAYSGPLYKGITVQNNQVVVSFTNTDGGLKTMEKPLSSFEIAGNDQIWKPAKAVIKGNTVVVESDQVSNPVAVRYAWRATSEASLFNGAGLPASSFSSESLK